jgi:hypothetical protein
MRVVELTPSHYVNTGKIYSDDVEFRKKQPMSDAEHARMFAT